jgi:hypothetical protein
VVRRLGLVRGLQAGFELRWRRSPRRRGSPHRLAGPDMGHPQPAELCSRRVGRCQPRPASRVSGRRRADDSQWRQRPRAAALGSCLGGAGLTASCGTGVVSTSMRSSGVQSSAVHIAASVSSFTVAPADRAFDAGLRPGSLPDEPQACYRVSRQQASAYVSHVISDNDGEFEVQSDCTRPKWLTETSSKICY